MWTVPQLHVGRGAYAEGVSVFPVWTSAPGVRGLDTGAAARVSATERSGSPSVGELVLHNVGPRPVLLLEGELLEGGWQHRALVDDVILAATTTQVVEVACVEQGRWAGSDGHCRRARRASTAVRGSLRNEPGRRQHDVWSRVAAHGAVTGPSATGSLIDHLNRIEDPGQRGFEPALEQVVALLPGQRGVVLGVGGRPLALELFGSAKALAAHLPGLLAAARLDASLVPPQHRRPVEGWRARDMAAYLDSVDLFGARESGAGVIVEARTTHADLRGIATASGALAHLGVLNTRHPVLALA